MSSLVPEGWVSTTIGEATSEISDGGTPATSNAEYFNGSIPWVVIDDIQPRIVHTKSSITELGLQKSSAKLWDKGTIILSTGATIGEVGIAMKAMATKQGICGVVVKSDVSAKYFYHLLVSKKRQLNILSQGSTIKETRPPTVKKIQICLPPLPEQKKIASILTSVDEVIENILKQIDKLQDLKKATMNELLTKGIGHTKFKDSELGRIPKSWECLKMASIAKVTDGAHKTPKYMDSGIPFLRVTDIQSREIDTQKTKYISTKEHLELCKRCHPERGDILYSKNGTIGISKIIDWDWDFSIFVSLALLKLHDRDNIRIEFLDLYLQSPLIAKQIKDRSKQGTVTNLHLEEIREFDIVMPSTDEQLEITAIIRSIQGRIIKVKEKLRQTKSIKKSLMQDLLTGKVRVTVN